MWLDEPRIQLTFEKIIEKLAKLDPQFATGKNENDVLSSCIFKFLCRWAEERVLTGKIFLYLERYGFINFGVFKRLTAPLGGKKEKPRVIIIGAGIAGIIAARQLQYFGFETIILEGRVRRTNSIRFDFFVRLESCRWSNSNVSKKWFHCWSRCDGRDGFRWKSCFCSTKSNKSRFNSCETQMSDVRMFTKCGTLIVRLSTLRLSFLPVHQSIC